MKNYLLLFLLLFLCSCSEDLYKTIGKTDVSPKVTKPVVISFEKEDSIIIQWDKDIGADKYILYRSESPEGYYSEIYRGTELSYTDDVSGYETGKFFYYKLSKIRESVTFEKSDYSYGVVALIKNDTSENNDYENNAVSFDTKKTISGNIYYYRDEYENELVDTEWFKRSVDPNFYGKFIINFENQPGGENWDNNLVLYSNYTDQGIIELSDQTGFNIYNRNNHLQELTFKIGVNKNNILGNPGSSGHKTIVYLLTFQGSSAIDN